MNLEIVTLRLSKKFTLSVRMLQSNEHFSGLFALENFEFVNFDTAPEEFSTDDKFVLGIIQTQSKPIFESHFNGILGLANYGQDLSFSDSVLNKLYDVIIINDHLERSN